MTKTKQDPKNKLINSIKRLKGQIEALEQMLETIDLDDAEQVKKTNQLFRAVRSASSSYYDRFKELYIRHNLLQSLEQAKSLLD